MIVVHVDRSVTVLSDVFCWQPLKHWHPCWSCLPSYQPDDLPLFRCMQCKNCPPMPSWVSCLCNAGGWWIKKFASEFGILGSAATVSEFHSTIYAPIWLEDLKFDLTQDGGLELWGMLQIPIQPDIFLQQLTVDGHIFSWIDRCCHSSTGDQQIKLLSLDGFILGYSLFRFRFEWHFFRIVFSYILTNAAKWSVLVIFTIIFFQLFCPKRRDEPRKKQEQHALVDVFRMMNATIIFLGVQWFSMYEYPPENLT